MSGIILGGITLNPSLRWEERYTSQSVAQSVRRTLGGNPVIFSGALTKGEPITLETWSDGGEYGLLRKSVVEQILALAAVPGDTMILDFDDVEIQVIFNHPDAVKFDPIYPRTEQQPTDYMRGSIKLLTV